jgi:hypothetical protein
MCPGDSLKWKCKQNVTNFAPARVLQDFEEASQHPLGWYRNRGARMEYLAQNVKVNDFSRLRAG